MEFYICRNTENSSSRFCVYDSLGNKHCSITGKFGFLGDTLRIRNTDDTPIFKILQSSVTLPLTVYYLSGNGERVRLTYNHVKKKFSLAGVSWFIKGMSPIFEVIDADNTQVMSQKLMPNGSLRVNINYTDKQLLCIAVAICINSMETLPEISAQPT